MKQKIITALLCWLCVFSTAQATPVELDRIIAIVNDEAISQSEVNAELEIVKLQLNQQTNKLPDDSILQAQVTERLIVKHVQQQLAKRNNIVVDDETLNRALTKIAEQNNISLAQLRATLEQDGYDFNAYRENIRFEILQTRLRQRYVDTRINITDIEVDQLLSQQSSAGSTDNELHLGHILIGLPEGASPEEINVAHKKTNTLIEKLGNGVDFTQTAIEISDGQLALSGGDLGWHKIGQLPSLFANAAANLKEGELSKALRSPSGFHIIKLFERRNGERRIVQQHHARHILIKTNMLIDDATAKQRLLDLKNRIELGDDFAELAKSHSDDKGSTAQGGDLGWSSPGQMVPTFETVMHTVEIGKISEPFQSQFGWHILEVLSRREHDDTEQYRRNTIRQQLFERKVAEEQTLWLKRLRDEAYVEIRL
jgi:peptidyl-prolyl cis-trans isomerase SurA